MDIDQNFVVEEIHRCLGLYSNFDDVKDLVIALYQAQADFFDQHSDLIANKINLGLSQEEIDDQLRNSKVLLPEGELSSELFLELTRSIIETVIDFEAALEEELEMLMEFLEERIDGESFVVDEIPELIKGAAEETSAAIDLVTFLLTFSASAAYKSSWDQSLEEIDTSLWNEGHCPVCGMQPHYGIISEQEGYRELECWLCSTRWIFQRLMCPYCQNTDQEEMGYFSFEERVETCRVHFCQVCDKYLKVYDLREHEKENALLQVHNLATLSHDLIARKEGFNSGSALEWVNDGELES